MTLDILMAGTMVPKQWKGGSRSLVRVGYSNQCIGDFKQGPQILALVERSVEWQTQEDGTGHPLWCTNSYGGASGRSWSSCMMCCAGYFRCVDQVA